MALTTHLKSCKVASRTVGGVAGASRVLEVGLESTGELRDAGGSVCGSGWSVDGVFEGVLGETALMSGISSFGRDKASATTFASPLR